MFDRRGEAMRCVAACTFVAGLLAGGVVVWSCRPSSAPTPVAEDSIEHSPLPADRQGQSSRTAKAVSGDDRSPSEKQGLPLPFRKVVEDAIYKAVENGVKDILQKLRITDDFERKLLVAADWRPAPGAEPTPDPTGPYILAVLLLRPGSVAVPAETVDASGEGGRVIRWTRAFGPVERPVAVATLTLAEAGRLSQREKMLVYGTDQEWHVAAPGRPADNSGKK
jgi:hypothetical protein